MPMPLTRSTCRRALENLRLFTPGDIRFDEPLSRHGTWRIGGPADVMIEPSNAGQVAAVVRFARRQGVPLLVIGQGSNLLFDDAGLRGIVLKLGARFSRLEINGRRIAAEAGVWIPQLARQAARAGLSGLEHTIGIPGTLGGLVAMNGGSLRRTIGDNVLRVRIIDRDGNPALLTRAECRFGYRCSILQENGAVIVGADLECPEGDLRVMRSQMLTDLRERRRKFPRRGEPNCGSVFLSTAEMHATVGPPGRIIEESGLKGFRLGAAEVSRRHANFIINRGGAASREVLALIAHIRATVADRIGFDLRCEVRYVAPDGEILPADLTRRSQKGFCP